MRRVVVTGIGVITAGAANKEECWRQIVEGRTAITPLPPASLLAGLPVARVTAFDPSVYLDRRTLRRTERCGQLSGVAAIQACHDAALSLPLPDTLRCGIFEGTSLGPLASILECHREFLQEGCSSIRPGILATGMPGEASGITAYLLGIHGPAYTHAMGSVSSSSAIGHAFRAIRSGTIDLACAGGAEAPLAPEILRAFQSAGLLAHGNAPEHAMKPFDRRRDGFVIGEGSAFLILEERERALERKARIIAELAGFGESTDAFHPTSPHPEGLWSARAITEALRDAALRPDEIGYINAHGTATPKNDPAETRAIMRAMGTRAADLPVSSTKPFTGHLLGAAGAVEAAITVLALERAFLPPTLNLEEPDPECPLDYIPRQGRSAKINAAISLNSGFGGRNTALVFRSGSPISPSMPAGTNSQAPNHNRRRSE